MAQEFQIDEAQRIVWVRCSGELTDADLRAHQEALRGDPRFRPEFSQLVDCSAVTEVSVTIRMVWQLGQSTLFKPEAKRAYVVKRDVLFGLVRMYGLYQSLRGKSEVKVFRERAEAVEWLGVVDPLDREPLKKTG
jgi:hypothetical protein